jgi:hypothetical protein
MIGHGVVTSFLERGLDVRATTRVAEPARGRHRRQASGAVEAIPFDVFRHT